MDLLNQSLLNVLAVLSDLGKFRHEHDKEMDTYYTNTSEEITNESQEAAARVSELEKNLCQLQNKFRHEEIEEKQIQADTEALSIELNKACDALITLQYQLHDHQFELQFQSDSKRILSEMISTSNSPHEDEISIRLPSIMANIDTTILKEEEEIKKINVLISHKTDEVSQVRKKLEDATDLLNMKHDHMANIQKDIDDINSQIRHNQIVVSVNEEMTMTLKLWFKKS